MISTILSTFTPARLEHMARAMGAPLPSPTLSTYRRTKLLVAVMDATLRRALGAAIGAVATVAAFVALGVL